MKKMKMLLYTLAGLYVLVLAIAYFAQDSLLFYPQKLDAGYKYQLGEGDKEVFIKTADNQTINGLLYQRPQNKNVVLYFHGNGGSLDSWQQMAGEILALNADLLIIDYRGYGKSDGEYSEKGFYEDGKAAMQYLLSAGYKSEQIILYGRSLGTGVATELAVNEKAKCLVLESPYTSMNGLAMEKFPYLLPVLTLKYRLCSIEKAPKLKIPVLILHGKNDELIPYAHGQKLFDAITAPKKLVLVEGAGHNNLSAFPEHQLALKNFLESI